MLESLECKLYVAIIQCDQNYALNGEKAVLLETLQLEICRKFLHTKVNASV